MKTLNIAVFGDIHYPISGSAKAVDNKISTLADLNKHLSKNNISEIFADAIACHKLRPFDCALFAGDFTDKGCADGFQNCLKYIVGALGALNVPLIGVPGNHDLQSPEQPLDNPNRFTPFESIAASIPGLALSFKPSQFFDNLFGGPKISLYALNSCASCNQIWQSPVSRALATFLFDKKIIPTTSDLYEMYDAPYLDAAAIDEVIDHIATRQVELPIVLTHHNILSQRTPRIAVFPEMLNSGYARTKLIRIDQPVIYLHGHVHDDCIDVLSNPTNFSQVGIVAVSAPLISEGYLHLKILLSDTDKPISVRVVQRRVTKGTITEEGKTILFYERSTAKKMLPADAKELMKHARNRRRYDQVQGSYSGETINALECSGFIKIEKPTLNDTASWRIEAVSL